MQDGVSVGIGTTFDVQVARSVEEIGQAAWDRLGAGQPFASFRWYRFAEAALNSDQPIYVVLSRQGEPLARATFWLKRREYLPVTSKIAYHLLQTLIRVRPLLVCRSPLSSLSGLILPPPPLRDAAIATLATTAQEIARQHGVSFTLFDYLEAPEQQSSGWTDAYAVFKFSNPGTYLDITWPDFESYLGRLGKSVRKDYHRHCNRAADLGIVVEVGSQVTEIDRAMALIHNVERHHGSFPNPDARRVLETAHLADATWLTARIDGDLVGCGLLLGDRGGKVLALLGLNYDIKYVSFQLVYASIRHAI